MGQRGPKPTPPALQLVRGDPRNQGKAKLAALLDETIRPAVEIPDAPKTLSKEARDEWERIAPHLARLRLISQIDRAALAAYCTAWSDHQWAVHRLGELDRQPDDDQHLAVLRQIRNRALELMERFMHEFGMSPAARSRVAASDQAALPGFEKPQEGGWGRS